MRISFDTSDEAIRIATAELVRLGVDIEELREQIEAISADAYAEEDGLSKPDWVTNEFFPFLR